MWTWLKLLKGLFVLFIYYQNYIQIMQINKYCHEVFFYYKYKYTAKISWQVKYPTYSQILLRNNSNKQNYQINKIHIFFTQKQNYLPIDQESAKFKIDKNV